nr:MAG TPA: hypothetical protein [Caudoviricetes sp.]
MSHEEASNDLRIRGIISLGFPWDFSCFFIIR